MNAADLLAAALMDEGVDLLFGYPGGAILPFYDALYRSPIKHVLARHEQGAVFAADGYARASGKVGVCVATSGPGATNLITGLANAAMDSVPILAITGQVPQALMGSDAFQEVDVLGMTMPVVKHSYLVRDPADLYRIAREAMAIARSGRPGPVLIDLPKDVQFADIDEAEARRRWRGPPKRIATPGAPGTLALTSALELLQAAERPLIYGGGGIFLGGAVDAFRRFVETTGAPTVLTLKGLGSLPGDHPQFLGMLGMHGLKAANLAVQECDLLICAGARFDDRVTGKLEKFCPEAKVIHLDVDRAEVGKRRGPDAPVVGHLATSLEALSAPLRIGEWAERCSRLKADTPWDYDMPGDGVYAPRFLKDLGVAASLRSPTDTFIAADVGQHQMWVAQHYGFRDPRHHLTSGGLGAMGYGLPAAIGAQLARPDAAVINVSGDGGILMNVQELATVRRYDLPLKIIVIDNASLGMVRQWQELFMEQRYSETELDDNPDFCEVAKAFGIPAIRLDRAADEAATIERILTEPGPLLVHVLIDPKANVWPFVPPGADNSNMLEGTP